MSNSTKLFSKKHRTLNINVTKIKLLLLLHRRSHQKNIFSAGPHTIAHVFTSNSGRGAFGFRYVSDGEYRFFPRPLRTQIALAADSGAMVVAVGGGTR